MYPTSQRYKDAIYSRKARETRIEGFILSKSAGTSIFLTPDDLKLGSLYIETIPVGKRPFCIGEVYTKKMQVAIKRKTPRYTILTNTTADAEISFGFYLKYEDGTEEFIRLGYYYIESAKIDGDYLKITAYDGMMKAEKPIEPPDGVKIKLRGTPYELLKEACLLSKIPIGFSQSEVDAISFGYEGPQGSDIVTFDAWKAKPSLSTYRDIISMVCTTIGRVAVMDKDGYLRLKKLSFQQDKPALVEIHDQIRKKATFYDNEVIVNKLWFKNPNTGKWYAITNDFTGPDNPDAPAPDVINEYYCGYTPFTVSAEVLDYVDLQTITENILEHAVAENTIYLSKTKPSYKPCSVEFLGDPAIEIGDIINLTGKDADPNGTKLIVSSIKYKYHGTQELSSIGVGKERSQILRSEVSKEDKIIVQDERPKNTISSYIEKNVIDINLHNEDFHYFTGGTYYINEPADTFCDISYDMFLQPGKYQIGYSAEGVDEKEVYFPDSMFVNVPPGGYVQNIVLSPYIPKSALPNSKKVRFSAYIRRIGNVGDAPAKVYKGSSLKFRLLNQVAPPVFSSVKPAGSIIPTAEDVKPPDDWPFASLTYVQGEESPFIGMTLNNSEFHYMNMGAKFDITDTTHADYNMNLRLQIPTGKYEVQILLKRGTERKLFPKVYINSYHNDEELNVPVLIPSMITKDDAVNNPYIILPYIRRVDFPGGQTIVKRRAGTCVDIRNPYGFNVFKNIGAPTKEDIDKI